ncbi:MAG: hypothetical protein NT004_09655 [Bacteroidetes bacterium]|nr:hypothetical protein [Bacteroidota bacterium]
MGILSKLLQLLAIAILCCSPLNMAAQPKADSLLNVVKHAEGEEKFNALKALSKLYRPTDPEKSLKFA